jgi:hypothetical protein
MFSFQGAISLGPEGFAVNRILAATAINFTRRSPCCQHEVISNPSVLVRIAGRLTGGFLMYHIGGRQRNIPNI